MPPRRALRSPTCSAMAAAWGASLSSACRCSTNITRSSTAPQPVATASSTSLSASNTLLPPSVLLHLQALLAGLREHRADVGQVLAAPEEFAVDDKGRRAEDAGGLGIAT